MDVDEAAADLYGLPLDEFTAARDAIAKRARVDGDKDVAAQIKSLRKPNTAAWLANQLVRAHRAEIEALVDIGAQMHEATAAHDGGRLRELTAERNDAINSLLANARGIAGPKVAADTIESLNQTLLAAVADPASGAELLSGRLTQALSHVGFGVVTFAEPADVVSLSDARSARESAKKAASTKTSKAARKPAEEVPAKDAKQELAEADAALTAAEERVAELRTKLTEREAAVDAAAEEVKRLNNELKAAQTSLDEAQIEVEKVEDALDHARSEVEAASRRRRHLKLQIP